MSRARLVFAATDTTGRRGVWQTDGTSAGTIQITAPATAAASGWNPSSFASIDQTVLFAGADSAGKSGLFALDGRSGTVSEVTVAGSDAAGGLNPDGLVTVNHGVYMAGTDANGARALFASDGTAAGTSELLTAKGGGSLSPADITGFAGRLVFDATAADVEGLFVSDATTPGTNKLALSGTVSAVPFVPPHGIASIGSRFLFIANTPVNQRALFVSDGTVAGTKQLSVAGMNPSNGFGGAPAGLLAFGARAAFVAGDAAGVQRIWVTDGTGAGTFALPGLNSLTAGTPMTALPDGRLAFVAADASGLFGVWLTDGFSSTVQIPVAGANPAGLFPNAVMTLGDRVVFDGVNTTGARTLFISDGTAAGTTVLRSNLGLVSGIDTDAAAMPSFNDDFTDAPGNQTYAGTGDHNTLTINEGRRGDTFVLGSDGSVQVGHGGQVDTVSGIGEIKFIDGRVVFDPADPAASVTRLYRAALGRSPDQGGLVFWTASIKAGAPLVTLADGFLSSSEFTGRFGSGLANVDYVTRLYQNVLGRAPDASGLAFFTGDLDSGKASRAQTLVAISESAENKAVTAPVVAAGIWSPSASAAEVARLYDTTLGRLPDQGGLAYWTNAIDRGATLLDVANGFVGTPEFVATYAALDDRGFVQAVYANTLHRPADAEGTDFWVNALGSGMSRAQVTVGFSESAEHQSNTAANIMSDTPAQYGIRMG